MSRIGVMEEMPMIKLRRNDPCFCKSGKRYKRCHGSIEYQESVIRSVRQHEAREIIRRQQQGLGKPIISFDLAGQKIVAVRNKLIYSDRWKTFADFLIDYLITTLDSFWVASEAAKNGKCRHVICDWLDELQEQRKNGVKSENGLVGTPLNGLAACVFGLAYSLYLIDHNAELQTRLVHRLKNQDGFQGAYYELIIANILIRAGYTLQLEDETGRGPKHCEFSATYAQTGKKYWVEAKARAVSGILGKTDENGCDQTEHCTSRLIKHLTSALAKPADSDKLIFIDLNAPPAAISSEPDIRALSGEIARKIERYCHINKPEHAAYVFVTNLPFHRLLNSPVPIMVVPLGINKPEFNIPGTYTLREMYRREMLHIDAYNITHSFSDYMNVPSTFDGALPSERDGKSNRAIIGETYDFQDAVPGRIATVRTACVMKSEKAAAIAVTAQDGKNYLLTNPMSDEELADYATHGDAYFGEPEKRNGGNIDSPYEAFKWLMYVYKETTREKLLEWLPPHLPETGFAVDQSTDDLREIYCEGAAIKLFTSGNK